MRKVFRFGKSNKFCLRQVYFTVGLIACLALGLAGAAQAVGYLKIHPSNPHYFQEAGAGEPVLLAGYGSIVPSDTSWDYAAGINEIISRRIRCSRVWHFLPWAGSNAVWPWARSGVGGAPMGGNKIDMNTWNSTYWSRMADAMSRANVGGNYAEIHLFDRCGMSPPSPTRWQGNPWAYENNINNLETPTAYDDGTPEFYYYSSKPNLRNQQERYIRKMIDETIAYPNVYYEIENEHWDYSDPVWVTHYSQFVKDYIAANYPSQPRLVSYSSLESDLEACYSIPTVDIVNKHYGGEFEADPSIANDYIEPRWGYNKAICIDEFANGLTDPNVLREQCWTIIASGGNFDIEDALPGANPYDICENIRSFLALSGWDFISSAPNKNLITSGGGYCMAQPGVEYVCYFPSGGSKTISLSAGSYRVEWWNPRTGAFYNVTNISHGGGGRALSTPDSNDWVLHIANQDAPPTVLESNTAGSITIDGSSSDWNLAELATKTRGGDVGTGNKAIVGYDTDGVCYSGGHSTAYQFPPTNAQDHAVRIYSRHSASYLYFLIRCDDTDIRYPNPVGSNWANDCVEIYIDPGHDGGASGISNSTSDIQLVIDASNQKNVYMTTTTYRTQVLNGVASAVSRDGSGWWLEVRITKTALDPDIPSVGTVGIDFNVRDNDQNLDAQTTVYTWRDPEVSTGFPTKIPDRWGDLALLGTSDTTPPGPVTSFVATPGEGQVSLSWHNPSDADFTGTMIRYNTTTYPTSPTDGLLVIDKAGSPNANDSHTHTGLTGGVPYYYTAFAHDGTPNYSTAANATATPTIPSVDWNTLGDQVTAGNGYTPGIAVDSQGNLHVVYMAGGHVYYRQANSSLQFGTPVQIPDPPEGSGDYCCPCVKCDQDDVPHVAFQRGWAGDSHKTWYSNRIGGSWKTPVKIIDNDIQQLDGRANYPRMCLYGSYAYVSVFGVPGELVDGSEGTIVRVTNLAGTPSVDRTAYNRLWVPHILAASDGRLFCLGRYGAQGVRYQQYDLNLSPVGDLVMLTEGLEHRPGEENGACIGPDNVIHVAGAVNLDHGTGVWIGHIFYNSSARVAQGKSPIVGLEGTTSWDHIQVYPVVAVDPALKVYVSWWIDPTGQAKITMINGDAYATPVTYAPSVTQYMRWNPQIAPTPTGGVYAAWDSAGVAYVRGIGVGSHIPDPTPPGPVTGFTATPGNGKVTLSWTNPTDSDFQGTRIRYKTTGYPTGPTDGTLVIDKPGSPGSAGSHIHTGLTGGVTYYYAAFAHDAVPNYASAATANATPEGGGVAVPTVNVKTTTGITLDGNPNDWNLPEFTEKARGGIAELGDYAIIGFDSGTLYYGGYWIDGVLPTNASDHTAKVYSRHDATYQYFLVRCDDSDVNYANGVDTNWANDCVEFYIDPGHNHGSSSISDSTSDIQLVVDANNRVNVYMTTSSYRTQVLSGVTSAVARDGAGWWAEVRIQKSALDPDIPDNGTFGVDFCFRDNDNPDATYWSGHPSYSTMYSWSDSPSVPGFPNKIPDNWGDAVLASLVPDTTPPGPVTSFAAAAGESQITLSWHNPSDVDFTGTMIRYKTTGYPTGATDGTLVADKSGSPGGDDNHVHGGLTAGVTYYYSAFAHDAVPNYSSKADASATPWASTFCLSDSFSYPNGNLNGNGGWSGAATSEIEVVNQTVRINGGSGTPDATHTVSCSGGASGVIQVTIQVKAGFGSHTMWNLWIDDPAGNNLARWYGTGTTARGRIGGTNIATDPQNLTGDWDDLVVKIYTSTNESEFFFNGANIGTLSHVITGAGDTAGRLVFDRVDHSEAVGEYLYFDNLTVGESGIPPGPVTNFNATRGDELVRLTWRTPIDADFTGTMIRYSTTSYPTSPTDGALAIDKPNTPDTADMWYHYGLVNGNTYYYSAFAHDDGPNYSAAAQASATPADTVAPDSVSGFFVVVGNEMNNLSWTNPSDSDYAGTKILGKTTGYPADPTDGTVVYDDAGTTCTHTSLANGTTYYYAAFAHDEVPNYSSSAQASGEPIYFGPAQAKMCADNTSLTLTVGTVSAVFGDAFYVQCSEAACGLAGIKVVKSSHGADVGDVVAGIEGTILTDPTNLERYIAATHVFSDGSDAVAPHGLTNTMLGGLDWHYNEITGAGQKGVLDGIGLNNIGLLVRVWGKVTQRDTSGLQYFYIDDGSGILDGTQTAATDNVGIRILADPTPYSSGDYVTITGISSCFKDGSGGIRRQVVPVSVEVVEP